MTERTHPTTPTSPTRVRRARLGWLSPILPLLASCSLEPEPDESIELRELDDGLLLHWTFEDSVGSQITDISGNGRHGTLQGTALVDSPQGKAASLDGVDDWISLTSPPRSPALYGGVDGSFTLSARVKVGNASKYNTFCVGCGPFSTLYVGTEPQGPALLSALDDQTSSAWKWLTSSATLVNDTWTEVTLVVENGSAARYYIDCQLDAQLQTDTLGLIDVGSSSIGKSTVASRWFGGQIDELRVWDRVLTDTELAQLCPVVDPLDEGLQLHWTFEDRSGNQILDVSGKGRHGTVVGGAAFVASPKGDALQLDGVDDRVTFTGPRALDLYGGATGDMTFSARVRASDVGRYNTLCVGCGPFSTMYVGDPNPGARVLSTLWKLDTLTTAWTATPALLNDDEWTEITFVVDGGVAARTYLDCGLTTTATGNYGLRDPGLSVLGQGNLADRWFGGQVDELRVWSRALPEQDIALLCGATVCDGPIHVDVDAPAGGDGITWASAFNDLQAAIDASAGCESPQVWVAEGQYAAATTTAPVASLTHDLEIYGGFAGTETLLAERDPVAHPVRLGADAWQSRVVRVTGNYAAVRLDGVSIVASSKGAIEIVGNGTSQSVVLDNMAITDNVGAAGAAITTQGASVTLTLRDSAFERNGTSTLNGGALSVQGSPLVIEDSRFVDNVGKLGGAIYLLESGTSAHQITGTRFEGNDAAWGGAIYVDDLPAIVGYVALAVSGGEFVANGATSGGGAVYLEESTTSFEGVAFVDNEGWVGGAILLGAGAVDVVNDALEITNCRFLANSTINGSGGALRLQEVGTLVINSEFVANTATTVGGAVWGRGDFIGSTFTNNVAGTGAALYAPAGPAMRFEHCVVYPDTIFGADIQAPHSCTKSNTLLGTPKTLLTNQSPFAAADLDLDGRTEWYLDPAGPCVGLEGAVIDEFAWSTLTVDASQCTDAGWPEPGVHYTPQSAVGACE